MPDATQADLLRLLVLPDGEVHATFADRSAVIVNHTAACLAIVHPDGKTTRQLTGCVTSTNQDKARQALHARNTLCLGAPRVQWELLPPDRAVHFFDAPSRPQRVSWPSEPGEAQVVRHADGAVRVISLDRLAWLLLHPDQHVFSVCFPAPTDASGGAAQAVDFEQPLPPVSPPPGAMLRAVFCTQLHSTNDVPLSWLHPLHLALEAANTPSAPCASAPGGWVPAAELLFLQPTDPAAGARQPVQSMVAPLPAGVTIGAPAASSESGPAGGVRVALPGVTDDAGADPRADWRLSPAADALQAVSATPLSSWLPARGARLVLTPYGLVRLPVNRAHAVPPPEGRGLLRLQLLHDDAELELSANGRFWHAVASGGADATGGADADAVCGARRAVYAVGAVPPTLRCAAGGAAAAHAAVPLAELAACCEQLARETRHLPRGALDGSEAATAAAGAARAGGAAAASQLLAEAELEGMGRFRKFGDGRLVASFEDRTVVTMLPPTLASGASGAADAPVAGVGAGEGGVLFGWYLASVVFPDGRTTQVRSDCPVGAEGYIDAMRQFDNWASRTPQQRLEHAAEQFQQQLALQSEVQRISSHLAVSACMTGAPPPFEASELGASLAARPTPRAPRDGVALAAAEGAAELASGARHVNEELLKLEQALLPADAPRPDPSLCEAIPLVSRVSAADELARIDKFLAEVSA